MTHNRGLLIVLSGFSGAGKGTIMKHLLAEYPGQYHLSVSATTRKPRDGEVDGREYFFKTQEQFDQMVSEGAFLEHASFNGRSYGTPRAYVEKLLSEGKDVILEIEVQGAFQVKKILPETLLLFVTPPSAESLKERLVGRGTEDAETIAQRLAISSRESHLMSQYDYLIINDQLDECVHRVHEIIASEHFKTARNQEEIKDMQNQLLVFAKGEKL